MTDTPLKGLLLASLTVACSEVANAELIVVPAGPCRSGYG